jgi:hypothetical protein
MTPIEQKKNVLNEQLLLLTRRYQAAASQRNRTLNEADRILLDQQLDGLYAEMEQISDQLSRLEQNTGEGPAAPRHRHWEAKLPQIDFRQAWSDFQTIFQNHLEGEAGGALLLLLPDCETMCAHLLVRRIHTWLQTEIGYAKVKHLGIEILEHNQLTALQLLNRLGSHFNHALPEHEATNLAESQLHAHVASLVDKLCGSLDRDQTLLIEMTVVAPEFYGEQPFLTWFLDDFWTRLTQTLAVVVRQQQRPGLKCILTLATDVALPPTPMLVERYCPAAQFGHDQGGKFVCLPLNDWSEEDIRIWLRRHSGVGDQWSEALLAEKARSIFARSRNGNPLRARTQLVEMLRALG